MLSEETIIGLASRLIQKNNIDRFPMIAIAFDGSRILGWAFNKKKTCPDPFHTHERYGCGMYDHNPHHVPFSTHAEVSLIRSLNTSNDFDMLVLRFKSDGSLGISKPCALCSHRLRDVDNLRNVWYHDGHDIASLSRMELC